MASTTTRIFIVCWTISWPKRAIQPEAAPAGPAYEFQDEIVASLQFDRAGLFGDGERRAEHERQSVLYHPCRNALVERQPYDFRRDRGGHGRVELAFLSGTRWLQGHPSLQAIFWKMVEIEESGAQ